MIELLSQGFVWRTFLASLLMAPLLAYFGVHVVSRRIVFVDLALAQIASVGVAVAFLLGWDPTVVSLAATFLGATLFAFHSRNPRIPQEAIMGAIYATASAMAVMIVAMAPHGEAEILNIFFASIFLPTPGQLLLLLLVYGGVALLQLLCFRQFYRLTRSHRDEAAATGPWAAGAEAQAVAGNRVWEFLFFISLGSIIAFGIRTGGVLLVFSYLIIPAIAALFLTSRPILPFFLSPLIGILGSIAGLFLSLRFDLPTGTSIVSMLGVALLLSALAQKLLPARGLRD